MTHISNGEPAISEKFNDFTRDIAKDMNVVSKQLDYQSAQVASTFNLFKTEIDKESAFLQRIKSKVSILQMYSNSPGNDLYYVGDSFDNLDFIDVNKIKTNRVPIIHGGNVRLQTKNTVQWKPNYVSVIQDYSNGFIGSNHEVYNTENVNDTTRFYFEDNLKVGYIPNIIDNNPLTYFEYEAINIPKAERERRGAKDYEFLYSKKTKENDRDVTKYLTWADHSPTSPLRLGISLSSNAPQKTNSLTIIPNLGNKNSTYPEVKIAKITAIDSNTQNEVDLIVDPIYIGSTIVPQSIESKRNYFYEKATVTFSEITTSRINVYFEQPNSQTAQIKHLYWKPSSFATNSMFQNQQRFNPEGLYASGYEAVNYNINSIIPPVEEPIKFKLDSNLLVKSINVSARKTRIQETVYVVKFNRPNSSNVLETNYLLSQYPVPSSSAGTGEEQYTRSATTNITSALKFSSRQEAEDVKTFVQNQLTTSTFSGKIYNWDPNKFQNLTVEQHIEYRDRDFRETVNLQPVYELYSGNRWVISIKSIESNYHIYDNSAEIVSKSFDFPYDIKNLMISSEVDNASLTSSSQQLIKYYVSLDDGNKWIQISPIENQFSSIPEVLSFNQNVFGALRIPGVSYFNYPEIPKEVRKIRVKIELFKANNANISPIVYSYKLCTKVEQL